MAATRLRNASSVSLRNSRWMLSRLIVAQALQQVTSFRTTDRRTATQVACTSVTHRLILSARCPRSRSTSVTDDITAVRGLHLSGVGNHEPTHVGKDSVTEHHIW
jgi:uncharacterized alpha-E superfamily protein